jgi:hypothetical protein
VKDDAGDYYGDGSDGMNARIMFLSYEFQDTSDGVAKAFYPVAEGEFFRLHGSGILDYAIAGKGERV